MGTEVPLESIERRFFSSLNRFSTFFDSFSLRVAILREERKKKKKREL